MDDSKAELSLLYEISMLPEVAGDEELAQLILDKVEQLVSAEKALLCRMTDGRWEPLALFGMAWSPDAPDDLIGQGEDPRVFLQSCVLGGCIGPDAGQRRLFYAWRSNPFDERERKLLAALSSRQEELVRKRVMEEELRSSENLYRTLFEAAFDGISVVDTEENILLANQAFAGQVGVESPQDLVGHNLAEFFSPDQFMVIRNKTDLRKGGHQSTYQLKLSRENGSRVISVAGAPLRRVGSGEMYATIGVTRDITEELNARRLQEEYTSRLEHEVEEKTSDLAQREGKLRAIFAAMTDLVMAFDLEGRCTEALQGGSTNGVFVPAVTRGRLVTDIFPGAAGKSILDSIQRALCDNQPVVFEFQLIVPAAGDEASEDKNGNVEKRIFHATASPVVDAGGRAVSAVIVARDLTEMRALEEQLLQSQKLETVGTLVGGIAHDFNNLLTAILGYSEMLSMRLKEDETCARFARQIGDAGERAKNLVQQILLFSRREPPRMEPLDPNACVNETLELLSRSINKRIQLRTDLEWQLPQIMADRMQIGQVLMNVCVNGAKAIEARQESRGSGTLLISSSLIQVEDQAHGVYRSVEPGWYVAITVTDDGVGMEEQTVSKIFEPFFTTREPGEGTGLGLSVAFSIIRRHHGQIFVQSASGEGTNVRILLPTRSGSFDTKAGIAQESKMTTEMAEAVADGAILETPCHGTILVVDDEDAARDVVVEYLQGQGYTVLEAMDGDDGIRLYQERGSEIDLVLMDVIMPRVGGVEACREIHAMDPAVRVLFITGHTGEHSQAEMLAVEGSVGVLHKPFSLNTLDRRIRRLLTS